jgi:hypothetical protein
VPARLLDPADAGDGLDGRDDPGDPERDGDGHVEGDLDALLLLLDAVAVVELPHPDETAGARLQPREEAGGGDRVVHELRRLLGEPRHRRDHLVAQNEVHEQDPRGRADRLRKEDGERAEPGKTGDRRARRRPASRPRRPARTRPGRGSAAWSRSARRSPPASPSRSPRGRSRRRRASSAPRRSAEGRDGHAARDAGGAMARGGVNDHRSREYAIDAGALPRCLRGGAGAIRS